MGRPENLRSALCASASPIATLLGRAVDSCLIANALPRGRALASGAVDACRLTLEQRHKYCCQLGRDCFRSPRISRKVLHVRFAVSLLPRHRRGLGARLARAQRNTVLIVDDLSAAAC
jgi:hypothetical protein